jgi:photosystem II stability/assembly factor-like uncharacterized protein
MKKSFLILILSAINVLLAQTDPNLKWLHPSPQGESIQWIKMWDDDNWYMGGDLGKFMKTSDAGKTWSMTNMAGWANPSYPGTYANNITQAAWFFDKNIGIAGGQGRGIVRTTNAGNTWDTIPILSGQGRIFAFHFVNNNLGFLVGNTNYRVMKTTDGGFTWAPTPSPLPASTGYSIYASDENSILVFGALGTVYQTLDGGNSWNNISIGEVHGQSIQASSFVNANVGYICGTGGIFSYTTDGGYNWNTSIISNNTFYAIKVINNTIYMAGYADTLYKSTNNGATWIKSCTSVPAQGQVYTASMNAIDKAGSTIVTGGYYGISMKSKDDGTSWELLNQLVSVASFVYGIYVENTKGKIIAQGHGWGAPGAIFYSTNGGQKWQQSPYAPPSNILHSKFLDKNNGWFVGEYTFLAKTHDGGINLDTIILQKPNIDNLNTNFWNLHFRTPNLGWIVGGWPFGFGPAIIYKTTDGGTTWIDQSLGNNLSLVAIDFADDNIGYVGGLGTLIKTTNGGTNWTSLTLPAGVSAVNGIKVMDKNFVYIYSSTKLLRTLDGGNSWTEIPLPYTSPSIFGMEWKGDFGVITGTLGLVLKTTNAGQSWSLMNTGGWTTYGINIISPDTFYIGGGDGQVFRYTNSSVPVELSSFLGNVNGNNVSLLWSTATEQNNNGFSIERSTDLKGWTNLTFIKGSGTSTEKHYYSYLDKNLSTGGYYYRLKQTDFDGTYKYYYLTSEIQVGAPAKFELSQNYPNPFNPSTMIKYAIPQDGNVSLKVFNIVGKEVAALVNGYQKAGLYNISFDAHYLPSGIYFYTLKSDNFTDTKKLILIK